MKKLIGAVLATILVTSPFISKNDLLCYEIYNFQTKVLSKAVWIREEDINVKPEDITGIMEKIEQNKRYIDKLISIKNHVVSNIFNILNVNAKIKVSMKDNQILSFQEFNSVYEREDELVNRYLEKINNREIKDLKFKVLSKSESNINIYYILEKICLYQEKVIRSLNLIINLGNMTSEVLCYN